MKTRLITVAIAMFGLAGAPTLLAQGCCGGGGAMKESCDSGGTTGAGGHEGHGAGTTATTAQSPGPKALFAQPVQSVLDNYIKVQEALAQDSLEGVSGAGNAMVKAIQGDSMRTLSPGVAKQSEALAAAKDLEAARAAFNSLSESLIQFVKRQKAAAGAYHVAYCPMAKASWLQTGRTIMNPYMGKAMVHCGRFKT